MNRVLVTGAAGFIGFHTCMRLLSDGFDVVGIDNLNDYYEVSLKEARLNELEKHENAEKFHFLKLDIADRQGVATLFADVGFDYVIHLAAQAGVRYSLQNPHVYADSNLVGHLNILEGCRHSKIKHLIYASSSSVYGMNTKMPFKTADSVDHPVSLYAATKKANELMSHTYSHLYGIPTTGLRFFTVYGPWGRPDMAPMIFTKAIVQGDKIHVNNHGKMERDFTYVDDIVEGIVRLIPVIPVRNPNWSPEDGAADTSSAPYKIFNIGAGRPTKLMDFINTLELELGQKAEKELRGMQAGDVVATWAETEDLFAAIDYRPRYSLNEGIPKFVRWYRDYFQSV
ncbi:NAD-dependent epimerase [Aliidiomarina sanyensis]|uniref:Protein CapI n=1 Tax=Aliidiomarina sanyensis TaxID=1249555 RepID=A0A432WGL1_9GAMM|nr:NAD-dependent epimerase [Aliidiomarina sanyensis]RUO32893.1 protein CapI [Aliidiomarina sanyensis]